MLTLLVSKVGLIVESDGGQHFDPDAVEYDRERTQKLNEKGFQVIRFRSDHVLKYSDVVEEKIYNELMRLSGLEEPEDPLPDPPPEYRGRE